MGGSALLIQYFGDVEGFLYTNTDLGSATRVYFLQCFNNVPKKLLLQLKCKLAAVIDVGERFIKNCYNLEDGILALSMYNI